MAYDFLINNSNWLRAWWVNCSSYMKTESHCARTNAFIVSSTRTKLWLWVAGLMN